MHRLTIPVLLAVLLGLRAPPANWPQWRGPAANGLIYMATETGIAACVDAATGQTLWRERLGGFFSASPVAADGKVYLVNEAGETVVLEAGRELKILSRNALEDRTLASPAISGGQIFLRTDGHLIAIGGKPRTETADKR